MKIKEFLIQDVSWSKLKESLSDSFTQNANQFCGKHHVALRTFLTLLFTFIVFWQSWTTDDAYHSYIMARHLAEGKGLVYNVGYRVTASTCPLLTLIQAGVYKITQNMVAAGILIGVLTSGATAAVLFFNFCTKIRFAIFAFFIMVLSYSFMSFTTSGLENSLLFLLGTLFLDRYFQKDEFNAKDLFILAVLLALLAIARMDTILIFVPMIVVAYLFMTKICLTKRIGVGILGLSPFILWEVFAIFYYGFPFPNTFYAKLFADYPVSEYLSKGLTYLHISFFFDCCLFIIPVSFLILAIYLRNKKGLLLFIGMFVYLIYIVRIGGDFMSGRHLTLNFILSLCSMCTLLSKYSDNSLSNEKAESSSSHHKVPQGVFAVCCMGLIVILSPFLKPLAEMNMGPSGVIDEKKYYCKYGAGTINMIKHSVTNEPDPMLQLTQKVFGKIEECYKNGDKGFLVPSWDYMVYGYVAYNMANVTDMYLTDLPGLMDPLLTRMPGAKVNWWRIGHIERIIPAGYIESVRTGQNLLVDSSLHEYYDKMLLIIAGDLFDKERLKTIFAMNAGYYDHLLEAYKSSITK